MNKKIKRRDKIKKSIRKKIFGTPDKPRLSVYKSNRSIFAQIIDDTKGITLISSTSKEKDLRVKASKLEKAVLAGKKLGEKAFKAGIKRVVFDRNGYIYHGRIKALAEAARESGLEF